MDGGEAAWRLSIPADSGRSYADAQLDDYHVLRGGQVRRQPLTARPPLTLRLRARASPAEPAGTLGFGFWNDPFTLSGGVLRAPECVWFFHASPPSDMVLVDDVPGRGWKAASLRAPRVPALLLLPAAAAAAALTRLPGLGQPILTAARRRLRAREALLPAGSLADWHTYEIDWRPEAAVFRVDGRELLRAPDPPRGPLGSVIWIDNQYAIASRAGRFGFGLCASSTPQTLEIDSLSLTPADPGRPG